MNAELRNISKNLGGTSEELANFEQIYAFLGVYPDTLSWRSKKNRPDIETYEGTKAIFKKYISGFRKQISPSIPKTIPDPVVYLIMREHFGRSTLFMDQDNEIHAQSMSSENVVGGFLEKYLSQKLQPFGWVWCVGNLIKATDFIKRDSSGWLLLQVKNRSNSENSSSQSIREGTSIQKWYRINARNGDTKWAEFPDAEAATILCEQEFSDFVKSHIIKLKS